MIRRRWTVKLRPATKVDVAEVLAWYKKEAPEQVRRFRDDFKESTKILADHPFLYPKRIGDVRLYAMPEFPYGIWYVADDATLTVHVLTVLHFKRGREALMDRLRAELGSSFKVITDRDKHERPA